MKTFLSKLKPAWWRCPSHREAILWKFAGVAWFLLLAALTGDWGYFGFIIRMADGILAGVYLEQGLRLANSCSSAKKAVEDGSIEKSIESMFESMGFQITDIKIGKPKSDVPVSKPTEEIN